MVDGYAGYQALFESGQALEFGCWMHARHKFFELFTTNKSPVAKLAQDTISELYKLERKIKHRSADKKRQWRQRHAKPRLDTFHQWLLLQQTQTPPNSGQRKELDSPQERWSALLRYLDDARVPLGSNRMENCIQELVVRRLVACREADGIYPESAGNCETQRPRPVYLVARCTDPLTDLA